MAANRGYFSKSLAIWLILLAIGTAVLCSGLLTTSPKNHDRWPVRSASVAAPNRASVTRSQLPIQAAGKQRANSVTDTLVQDDGLPAIDRFQDDSSAAVAARIFVNPPALLPRTAQAPTSIALPSANAGKGKQAGLKSPEQQGLQSDNQIAQARSEQDRTQRKPREELVTRGRTFDGDLRDLPHHRLLKSERPEREEPELNPAIRPGLTPETQPEIAPSAPITPSAPAPATSKNFDGLDFANWGAGHPPDTNGDVGPTYYIQTVNTSIGIFRKSDGVRVAAFTFNDFMSQGHFGNLCDTNNFGDPVVLYDTFEDRWIITDFAFQLDGSGNVVNPPGAFQCFAASKTGDPVSGGWNFYSINTTGGLGDYPKFGIWPDGLYMSANMFGYASGAPFQGPRVYAFNKAQMYAGAPSVQSVSFDAPVSDFTILPGNARLQTGTPPPGTPNYFLSTWQFLNALTVYKFHVDWNRTSLSTFTGPDTPLAATSWPNAAVANAPSLGGNSLDVLQIRAMMQNQYTNFGGVESLWATHTVRRANTTGFAAPRWYQVNVTGGTVAANLPQAATWDPDGANVLHRFMPSLAVDRAGNMALGYSTSSSTTKPAISYAGRLSTDPVNTLGQTEQLFIQGTGTQTGSCGGTCSRWGDYSAMTLDPDGCTFWYTNEYYAVDGLNDLTRIGAFALPACVPVGSGGTISGTVTDGSNPINGATVALGSRSTTTNASGAYSFTNIPAGTYPEIRASLAGYGSALVLSLVVSDGLTTTQNFILTAGSTNGCFTDTLQTDFQAGVGTNVDLNTSPDDVTLLNAPSVNQQNLTVGTSGVGITTTTWGGQTFTPSVTGQLVKADINLFCSGCTGTTPNLTLSLRTTSGGLPVGADLASATITGFNNGAAVFYTGTFSSPPTLTAGTQYALVIRPTVNPSPGTYALTRSGSATAGADVYAGGTRVAGATSGTVWSIPLTGGVSTDAGFRIYLQTGYASSGNLISGTKDANPAAGQAATWSTLTWNGTTPALTSISFQIAASNNVNGPFNFVGPDGTAGTFFTTSGASLAAFNGFRYLQYKAFLSTTDNTKTPTLNDVSLCFADIRPTISAASALSRQRGSASSNSQIATVSDSNQAANTLSVTATPLTGTGVTISNIAVNAAGNVTANVAAGCTAVNSTFTLQVTDNLGATASTILTVNVTANTAPTLSYQSQNVVFNGALAVSAATGPADNGSVASIILQSAGTYTGGISVNNASGAVSISNAAPVGPHTIVVRATDNCGSITDANLLLTVNKANQTITFGALSNKTFGDADFGVSATASSGLAVSFGASGNCTVNGSNVHITGAGSCTITASQAGNSNYNAAADVPQTFPIAKVNQTITFGTLANKTFGDADFGVTATASSGLAVSFGASGSCTITSGNVHLTGAGSCTITASQAGNSNYNAAPNVPQLFPIAKANQTITFGVLANRAFGDADFGVGATASSGLAVSFGASGNCTVTSGTVHLNGGGSCTITASQAGDSNYNAAPNVPQTFSIAKAASATALMSSVNPCDLTQSVTFTAAISATAGTPTGTVQFKDNGTNLGAPVALNASGVATLTTAALAAATHTITADYSGDGNFGVSSGALAGGQVVRPQPSLSINSTSITEGDSGTRLMNFTVTLSAASNLSVTVNFATANGNASAGSDYVAANGTLTFNPGDTTKTISVTINGDVNFEADENFNVNLTIPTNASVSGGTGTGTILNDDAAGGFISLSQAIYNVNEATGFVIITVNRTNDLSQAVSVDYSTDDTGAPGACGSNNGLASARCDFTTAIGTLQFAAGESQKTFTVLVNQDSFTEGSEMFAVGLSNATGGAMLSTPSSATIAIADSAVGGTPANLIDDPTFFVRQHYHDFLNREPDSPGLSFWVNQLTSCGADMACLEVRRINVSASFFLSIEFQQTGATSYLTNTAAFNSLPTFNRFEADSQALGQGYIFTAPGSAAVLEANKVAYFNKFVSRSDFLAIYGGLTNAQYVDQLIANTQVNFGQSTRDALVNGLNSSTETRATVLRKIVETPSFLQAQTNQMFVLMEYFGYLRRSPSDPPDNNLSGYNFWLTKLNQFSGNYIDAEMVKAFLSSIEYRQRFGP